MIKWFESLSIQKKWIYINFINLFIVMAVFFTVTYYISYNYYIGQFKFTSYQSNNQTKVLIEAIITDCKKTMSTIKNDIEILKFINVDKDFINGDTFEYFSNYATYLNFKSKISNIMDMFDISDITVYTKDGFAYDDAGRKNSFYQDESSNEWFGIMKKDGVSSLYYDSSNENDNNLYYIELIKSDQDYNVNIGAVKIAIPKNRFLDNLEVNRLTPNSVSIIENSKSEIIGITDSKNIKILNYNFYDLPYGINEVHIGSEKCIVVKDKISANDWMLINVVPYNDVFGLYTSYKTIVVSTFAILFVILMLVTNGMARVITKRLSKLMNSMQTVEKGVLNRVETSTTDDDVGKCITSYNSMLDRIEALLDLQFSNGKKQRELEYKLLQEQINPHFLYNTLEIINGLALKNNEQDICEITSYISEYYKLSLNNGNDLISLGEEIRQADIYLKIQNKRFEKNISLFTDVPDDLSLEPVLKMILQPIIENSVKHGFIKKKSNVVNEITIIAYREGEYIYMQINDNGIGMLPCELQRCLDVDNGNKGFGLKNINERIKLFYGDDFGITIESEHEEGTTVTVKIKSIIKRGLPITPPEDGIFS